MKKKGLFIVVIVGVIILVGGFIFTNIQKRDEEVKEYNALVQKNINQLTDLEGEPYFNSES